MTRRGSRGARRTVVAHWVVATLVGAVAGTGVGAAVLLRHDEEVPVSELSEGMRAARESDRFQRAVAALDEDGVFVADDGRHLLDEAGEQRVVAAVAEAPDPVYVVVWAEGQDVGVTEYDLVDALVDELGTRRGTERGTLVVWQGPETGAVEVLAEAGGSVPGYNGGYDLVGDAATTLPKVVRATADNYYYTDYGDDGPEDPLGGVGGGVLLGVLLGGTIMVLLWIGRLARRGLSGATTT